VSRNLPPWGEREIARFSFRVSLFMHRGLSEPDAETWADRLFERDHERDDRRMCIECDHWRTEYRCAKRGAALRDILQRCPSFSFKTP
jgi:hypothetical protein